MFVNFLLTEREKLQIALPVHPGICERLSKGRLTKVIGLMRTLRKNSWRRGVDLLLGVPVLVLFLVQLICSTPPATLLCEDSLARWFQYDYWLVTETYKSFSKKTDSFSGRRCDFSFLISLAVQYILLKIYYVSSLKVAKFFYYLYCFITTFYFIYRNNFHILHYNIWKVIVMFTPILILKSKTHSLTDLVRNAQ